MGEMWEDHDRTGPRRSRRKLPIAGSANKKRTLIYPDVMHAAAAVSLASVRMRARHALYASTVERVAPFSPNLNAANSHGRQRSRTKYETRVQVTI